MQSSTYETACLGKLPTHGDFVRHRASTPTMRTFDEWIRTGLHHLRQDRARAWEEAYDNAPTIRFLFSGRGQQAPNALLGVLRTSRDRTERMYPFTVTCELPKPSLSADHLAYLPLQADRFYTAAEQIVQEATEGTLPYPEVTDRVEQINPTLPLTSSPPAEYSRFIRQESTESFFETLFGRFGVPRKHELFKNLLDVFLPQRNRSTPRLNYGLQFPLGEDQNPLTKTACFWLDTCLRLLDHPNPELSFFWTPREISDSVSAFLLLFVGSPPHAHAVFHRLTSDEASEDLFEVSPTGSENETEARPSLPEAYGSLLENEQRSLREVLQHL